MHHKYLCYVPSCCSFTSYVPIHSAESEEDENEREEWKQKMNYDCEFVNIHSIQLTDFFCLLWIFIYFSLQFKDDEKHEIFNRKILLNLISVFRVNYHVRNICEILFRHLEEITAPD